MGRPMRDLTGHHFGRWKVLKLDHGEYVDETGKKQAARWLCVCTCGVLKSVRAVSLTHGLSRSCGCYNRDSHQSHGLSRHPLYDTWSSMVARCTNPNKHSYQYYGARGVKMYEPWINNPELFIDWVMANLGSKPSPAHSIDRVNNLSGHYVPGNLKWATQQEQTNNTRSNKLLTYHGKTQSVAMWCKELGLSADRTYARLSLGWSVEEVLTTPTDGKRHYRRRELEKN